MPKAWTPGELKSVPAGQPGIPVGRGGPYRIGLASWVIQDGNYGDFSTGMRTLFALEFLPVELVPLEPHALRRIACKHLLDNQYRIIGQVIFSHDDWYAIDFGLKAYHFHRPDKSWKPGEWVRGHIALDIDCFSYFENFSRNPSAPGLIYTWRVETVLRQAAPFIVRPSGMSVRDKAKWRWMKVGHTNAWKDDDGAADYLLECTLTDVPPLRNIQGE